MRVLSQGRLTHAARRSLPLRNVVECDQVTHEPALQEVSPPAKENEEKAVFSGQGAGQFEFSSKGLAGLRLW